jgi:hypothetical protein
MTSTLKRWLTPRVLLRRMLDEPDLPALVQALPAPALGRIVQRLGLEDSSDVLQFASPEQLSELIDQDSWHSSAPGEDERFDARRFALWLEVMLECGEDWVADKLVNLSEDLVTLAFQQQMLVLDTDQLAALLHGDPDELERAEKALSDCASEELDRYLIIARHPDGWDTLLTVLLALDKNHHHWLERLLERCCAISHDYVEDNGGLYDVLSAEELLESDVAGEREDRRAAQGYIAPSRATHFLRLARTTPLAALLGEEDNITRTYFRELGKPARHARPPARANAAAPARRLLALLEAAGSDDDHDGNEPPRAPLLTTAVAGAPANEAPAAALFRDAVQALLHRDPSLQERRLEELAYLANVLLSGASLHGRRFRGVEAATTSIAVCNLGLEHVIGTLALHHTGSLDPSTPLAALEAVAAHSAPQLFRVGWHLLQRPAALPARYRELVTSLSA